ncbi:MBL fold metallo-hydrolase [Hymenobacter sp. UYP22]|uniref:MBL fold metallo-hydrolase n=1 Tax=Hymenobacter sp. UYP22 TaxID=3156348 RepID=UPI0033913DCF
MKTSITMFPAMNGDCFLIEIGDKMRMLVDTGYVHTYRHHLKPYLTKIAAAGGQIDLCLITHIDADHIKGGSNGLFIDNKASDNPQIIGINQVWFNAYRHLPQKTASSETELSAVDVALLATMSAPEIENTDEFADSVIGAQMGMSLAKQLDLYCYLWNTSFDGNAVTAPATINLTSEITCHVLSPSPDKLEDLIKNWKRDLRQYGFKSDATDPLLFEAAYQNWLDSKKEVAEVLADISQPGGDTLDDFLRQPYVPDDSAANVSSIAFILEYADKRLLFLADAAAEVVLEHLIRLFPEANNTDPVWFDCIKVSHHGSFKNNSPDLMRLTDSDTYLISTNGRIHDHPDAETIAWIVSRPRRDGTIRKLYFNYHTATSAAFDRPDWKAEKGYEVIHATPESSIEINI